MPGDRRIAGKRQTELAKSRLTGNGHFCNRTPRQKPVHQKFLHFFPRDLRLQSTTDQFGSRTRHIYSCLLRSVFAQQRFFHPPTATNQHVPLSRRQLSIVRQLRFDVVCKCDIEVVATKNQMVANCHSMKLHSLGSRIVFRLPHFDQRKVGGSSADITNQNRVACRNQLGPFFVVFVNPGVETRLAVPRSVRHWAVPRWMRPPPSVRERLHRTRRAT